MNNYERVRIYNNDLESGEIQRKIKVHHNTQNNLQKKWLKHWKIYINKTVLVKNWQNSLFLHQQREKDAAGCGGCWLGPH